MANKKDFGSLARKLASKAKHGFAYHAVIIVRGGAVIATGYNHGECHAEINAMSKIWPNKRAGVKVWSVRITPGGRYGMALPCKWCMEFLIECGAKVVYYSTPEQKIESIKLERKRNSRNLAKFVHDRIPPEILAQRHKSAT
jgi:deoxycytidylate deaminase